MKKIAAFLFLVTVLQAAAQDPLAVKKSAFYLDIHAGPGLRLGEAAPTNNPTIQNQNEKLRDGVQFDVSLYFEVMPESNHRIGFKYNSFNKKAGIRGVGFIDQNGSYQAGNLTDNITLSFYGMGYMYAKPSARNAEWSVEAALGYMTFRDRAEVGQADYDLKGGTIGAFFGAGYYFRIVKGVYLGPKISLLVGAVDKINVEGPGPDEEIDLETPESLSRLDFSLGLRFKL